MWWYELIIPVLRGWVETGKLLRLTNLGYLVSFKPVKHLVEKNNNKNWPSEIAKLG